MYLKLINFLLSILDFRNKRKMLSFFKEKFGKNINIMFDVGSHHGETIILFSKTFNIKKIFGFEPSLINYNKLIKNVDHDNKKIYLYNFGLGIRDEILDFTQTPESSSSTFVKIDKNSNYFKKKYKIINLNNFIKKEFETLKCEVKKGETFFNDEIVYIDILKIDTEGFELEVIKGFEDKLKNIRYIYFEHHFDNMLKKSYKLSNIHEKLVSNDFKKAFKIKMTFRKAFEYIYVNTKIDLHKR